MLAERARDGKVTNRAKGKEEDGRGSRLDISFFPLLFLWLSHCFLAHATHPQAHAHTVFSVCLILIIVPLVFIFILIIRTRPTHIDHPRCFLCLCFFLLFPLSFYSPSFIYMYLIPLLSICISSRDLFTLRAHMHTHTPSLPL